MYPGCEGKREQILLESKDISVHLCLKGHFWSSSILGVTYEYITIPGGGEGRWTLWLEMHRSNTQLLCICPRITLPAVKQEQHPQAMRSQLFNLGVT